MASISARSGRSFACPAASAAPAPTPALANPTATTAAMLNCRLQNPAIRLSFLPFLLFQRVAGYQHDIVCPNKVGRASRQPRPCHARIHQRAHGVSFQAEALGRCQRRTRLVAAPIIDHAQLVPGKGILTVQAYGLAQQGSASACSLGSSLVTSAWPNNVMIIGSNGARSTARRSTGRLLATLPDSSRIWPSSSR